MRTLKAIVTGSLFIFVTLLLLQLGYVFLAVGYIELTAYLPFLNNVSGMFRYIVGIPVYMATMFVGGYITASMAGFDSNFKVQLHCIAVGLVVVGGMMYSVLENSSLTLTGIVVTVLALSASMAGGFFWLKYKDNKPPLNQ
ncbi:MAG: hypothetical protein OEY29_15300 [Gammaproteobacteria bacterium]|nr:hypothetical protein [Gammaproteobacteria bacterium]